MVPTFAEITLRDPAAYSRGSVVAEPRGADKTYFLIVEDLSMGSQFLSPM